MKQSPRFDRLARVYRWMEYFSFGPYLARCRMLRLAEMAAYRRALVYGDGDGRFLARLVRRVPAMEVVAVDASAAMLRAAARRLPAGARVTLHEADALHYEPQGGFDLVVSHFFLDCFSDAELEGLAARVNGAVIENAVWIVSDFAIPESPMLRVAGRWLVSLLYLSFGVLTGLRTRRLPDHAKALRTAGWMLEDRKTLLGGLLLSERWRMTTKTEHPS